MSLSFAAYWLGFVDIGSSVESVSGPFECSVGTSFEELFFEGSCKSFAALILVKVELPFAGDLKLPSPDGSNPKACESVVSFRVLQSS